MLVRIVVARVYKWPALSGSRKQIAFVLGAVADAASKEEIAPVEHQCDISPRSTLRTVVLNVAVINVRNLTLAIRTLAAEHFQQRTLDALVSVAALDTSTLSLRICASELICPLRR